MATRSETLKALRLSIAKWKKLSEGGGVDLGKNNCALCKLFINDNSQCHDCPVREYSGFAHCVGTPYPDWADGDMPCLPGIRPDSPRRLWAAKAEYRYLLKVRDYFKHNS